MKYKLVAIDMDGTLLNSENKVSKKTRQAIMTAKEKGVHIVLATGRILKSAKYYSKELQLKNPIVASNGGIIIDENEKVLYRKALGKESIRQIVSYAAEDDVYCHLYNETNFYSSKKVQEVLDFYSEGDDKMSIELEIFKDIDEILDREELNFYKLIFIDEDKEKLKNFRSRLSKIESISISSSWSNNIEAMDRDVSKGQAIKKLCKILDIKEEETMAIGDSENDLSMLSIAGLSVAMGNGSEKVKKAVDHITDTNDNDGVAKAIEKFILESENDRYES